VFLTLSKALSESDEVVSKKLSRRGKFSKGNSHMHKICIGWGIYANS
jgi:hypothetical protein